MKSEFESVGLALLEDKPPYWLVQSSSGRKYYVTTKRSTYGKDLAEFTVREIRERYENHS